MWSTSVGDIPHKEHWSVGRRLGLYRLTSAQPLIGSTIKELSISSALWVLEVMCYQYWHRLYQIYRSTLWWKVVTCWSKLVNVVSWMPRGCVLCLLLFLLYTLELFSILKNKLIGYADDSTLIGVVPFPGIKITVAESLNRYLDKISEWCDLYGIKLNTTKTTKKTMSLQVTHNASPVTHINYWQNCAEGVWWP